MTQAICFRNKFGYCKYCEKCRFRHNNEKCQDSECLVYNCEKRHPRNCKHFRQYGYCKFTTFCKFEHKKQLHIAENSEKIDKLEKKFQTIQISNAQDPNSNEDLAKIKSLEEIVNNLEKNIKEKDGVIDALSERLRDLEDKFTNIYIKEVNSKFTEIDKKLKIIEETTDNILFKCKECNFSSTTEKGLNIHIKRIHELQTDVIPYPKKCEVCEKDVKSKKEMKIHMKTHSYIRPHFKCEECDFICERELTMEVHIGKVHDESFECGLCSFTANSEENLAMHLITCEIYICAGCDKRELCEKRFKTISELKTHYTSDKILFKEFDKVIHAKVGRIYDSEVKETKYFKEDFFP